MKGQTIKLILPAGLNTNILYHIKLRGFETYPDDIVSVEDPTSVSPVPMLPDCTLHLHKKPKLNVQHITLPSKAKYPCNVSVYHRQQQTILIENELKGVKKKTNPLNFKLRYILISQAPNTLCCATVGKLDDAIIQSCNKNPHKKKENNGSCYQNDLQLENLL